MRKNPTYMALLRPTRLLISEKSATYTIKWSYTIIWQVRVGKAIMYYERYGFGQKSHLLYSNAFISQKIVNERVVKRKPKTCQRSL